MNSSTITVRPVRLSGASFNRKSMIPTCHDVELCQRIKQVIRSAIIDCHENIANQKRGTAEIQSSAQGDLSRALLGNIKKADRQHARQKLIVIEGSALRWLTKTHAVTVAARLTYAPVIPQFPAATGIKCHRKQGHKRSLKCCYRNISQNFMAKRPGQWARPMFRLQKITVTGCLRMVAIADPHKSTDKAAPPRTGRCCSPVQQ